MLSLMLVALSACDGRTENIVSTPVVAQTVLPQEILTPIENHQIFRITNQLEFESAVQFINQNEDNNKEYTLQIGGGEYQLGAQQVEVSSKHLDDTQRHIVSAGLVINTDSNLNIIAMDPQNKPKLIGDGVVNDVMVVINGTGSVNISDIQIHTNPIIANHDINPINTQNPVRAALYIVGDQISSKRVEINRIDLYDNVDRSDYKDELNVEYSGIIIKHAQSATLNDIRLERFYLDGISLFDVFNVFAKNIYILRDGARMRSGTGIGMITTAASYLQIDNLTVNGSYKGVNMSPSSGYTADGNTMVMRNSEFINTGGHMFYLVNASNATILLDNVKNEGPWGVAFPVYSCDHATIKNSIFTLLQYDPFTIYNTIEGARYVVRSTNVDVENSSIINSGFLLPESQNILDQQGFSLN